MNFSQSLKRFAFPFALFLSLVSLSRLATSSCQASIQTQEEKLQQRCHELEKECAQLKQELQAKRFGPVLPEDYTGKALFFGEGSSCFGVSYLSLVIGSIELLPKEQVSFRVIKSAFKADFERPHCAMNFFPYPFLLKKTTGNMVVAREILYLGIIRSEHFKVFDRVLIKDDKSSHDSFSRFKMGVIEKIVTGLLGNIYVVEVKKAKGSHPPCYLVVKEKNITLVPKASEKEKVKFTKSQKVKQPPLPPREINYPATVAQKPRKLLR